MRSNIFPEILEAALLRINPQLHREDVSALLDAIHLELQNENLGKAFHKRLTAGSGVRLIDFDNLDHAIRSAMLECASQMQCTRPRHENRHPSVAAC